MRVESGKWIGLLREENLRTMWFKRSGRCRALLLRYVAGWQARERCWRSIIIITVFAIKFVTPSAAKISSF